MTIDDIIIIDDNVWLMMTYIILKWYSCYSLTRKHYCWPQCYDDSDWWYDHILPWHDDVKKSPVKEKYWYSDDQYWYWYYYYY